MKINKVKTLTFTIIAILFIILLLRLTIAEGEFTIEKKKGTSILKDAKGNPLAEFGENFEVVESTSDKIIIKDKAGSISPGSKESVKFLSNGQTVYDVRLSRQGEITFSAKTNELIIPKGTNANVRTPETGFHDINDGKLRLDKNNQIEFAEFTSLEGGHLTFPTATIDAPPGYRVKYNLNENKIEAFSFIAKEKSISIDLKDINGNPIGQLNGPNIKILTDKNGNVKEIDLPNGGKYWDFTDQQRYSSNEKFTIYLDGRNIKALAENAVSVEKGKSTFAKGPIKVNDINNLLIYEGKSSDAYVEYNRNDKFFDVQKGNAEIDNGHNKLILSEGKTLLASSEQGFSDGSSFKVKYGDPEKADYFLLDGEANRLVAYKDGKETLVTGLPLQDSEAALAEKTQIGLSTKDFEASIKEKEQKLKENPKDNSIKEDLVALYTESAALAGNKRDSSEFYNKAKSLLLDLQKDNTLTKEQRHNAGLKLANINLAEENSVQARDIFTNIIGDTESNKETYKKIRESARIGQTISYIQEGKTNPTKYNPATQAALQGLNEFPDNKFFKETYKELTKGAIITDIGLSKLNKELIQEGLEKRWGGRWSAKGLGSLYSSITSKEDIELRTKIKLDTLSEAEKGKLLTVGLIDQGYSMDQIEKISQQEIEKVFSVSSQNALSMTKSIKSAFQEENIQLIKQGRPPVTFEVSTPDFLVKPLGEEAVDYFTSPEALALTVVGGRIIKSGTTAVTTAIKLSPKFGATPFGQALIKERHLENALPKLFRESVTYQLAAKTPLKDIPNTQKAIKEIIKNNPEGKLTFKPAASEFPELGLPPRQSVPVVTYKNPTAAKKAITNLQKNALTKTLSKPTTTETFVLQRVPFKDKELFVPYKIVSGNAETSLALATRVPIPSHLAISPTAQISQISQTPYLIAASLQNPLAQTIRPLLQATPQAAVPTTELRLHQEATSISTQAGELSQTIKTAPQITGPQQQNAIEAINRITKLETQLTGTEPTIQPEPVGNLIKITSQMGLSNSRKKLAKEILEANKADKFPLSNQEKQILQHYSNAETLQLEDLERVQEQIARLERVAPLPPKVPKIIPEAPITPSQAGKAAQIPEAPRTPAAAEDIAGIKENYKSDLALRGETPPQAKIDTSKLLGEGSGAKVFEGTVGSIEGKYAIKVYKNPPPGTPVKETLDYFNQEIENAKLLSDLGIGPKFISKVDVNGNPAFATEILQGKFPEELTASEARTLLVSAEDKLKEIVTKLKAKGYTQPDFQYYIITEDTFVNGKLVRKAGDIVFIDAGSLSKNPIYVDTFDSFVQRDIDTIKKIRETAQKLSAEKAAQIPIQKLKYKEDSTQKIEEKIFKERLHEVNRISEFPENIHNEYIEAALNRKVKQTVISGQPALRVTREDGSSFVLTFDENGNKIVLQDSEIVKPVKQSSIVPENKKPIGSQTPAEERQLRIKTGEIARQNVKPEPSSLIGLRVLEPTGKFTSDLYSSISRGNFEEIFQNDLSSVIRPGVKGTKAVIYEDYAGNYHVAFMTETINVHHRHTAATLAEFTDKKLFTGKELKEFTKKIEAIYNGDYSRAGDLLNKMSGFELQFDSATGKIYGIKQDSQLTKQQISLNRGLSQKEQKARVLELFDKIDQSLLNEELKSLSPDVLEKLIYKSILIMFVNDWNQAIAAPSKQGIPLLIQ